MNNTPAFSGHELSAKEAHEVVDLLRAGEISPAELVDISAGRIEAVEPDVNATVTVCADRARTAAAEWDGCDPSDAGWLGGLPIGIKDLMMVEGVRSTNGTPGKADFIAPKSHHLVHRLERRGGLVMGKTNTPEEGAGGNTFNPVFGATRNPWDTSKNAGGSSGGAAVSLATGEVWLSHGSDLAGSLRTPAAYCGVIGMRPSPGVASGGSEANRFGTEGVQGPMACSVRDCALFLDAMAGFEPSAPLSWPAPQTPYQKSVMEADGKVRIAYSRDMNGFAYTSKEMDEHLRGALEKVAAGGAVIDEACPDVDGLDRTYRTLRAMVWAAGPGREKASVQDQYKFTLMDNIRQGRELTADDIYDAQLGRAQLYDRTVNFLKDFDVLACPVVGLMPGPVEEEYPRVIDGVELTDYLDWLKFSFLSTTVSLPSISVPVGLRNGIPVGIQLIGQPRGEARLLQVARAFEVACGGPLGPIDPVRRH